MRRLIVGMAVMAMASGAGVFAQGEKRDTGKALYATLKCGTCHKVNGVGGKLASDLTGVGSKLSDGEIRKWLTKAAEQEAKLKTKPKMLMSTYLKKHKLTDADVDALTAYMLSLKKS